MEPPAFQVKKMGSYMSSTERQIREALLIQKGEYTNLMNSKSEWGTNSIPRQTVTFQDEIWKDKKEQRTPYQEDDEPPDQNSQPETRSKRQAAPNLFEGQYSQRKKRTRTERKNSTMISTNMRIRQESDVCPPGTRQRDTQALSNSPKNQTRDARLRERDPKNDPDGKAFGEGIE